VISISIDYSVSFIILLLLSMSHLQFVHITVHFIFFFTALTVRLVTVLTCFFNVPINVHFPCEPCIKFWS